MFVSRREAKVGEQRIVGGYSNFSICYFILVLRRLLLTLSLTYIPIGIPIIRDKVIAIVRRIILYISRNTMILIPTIVKPVKINAVLIIRLVRTEKYDLNLMFFSLNCSLILLEM